MPRRPIDDFWRERIRSITANNPKLGPGPVLQELRTIGKELVRSDWPSLRTVGRYQREVRAEPAAVQREYLEFRWPEAMERGDLPWEAAPVALEALRAFHGGGLGAGLLLGPSHRPSVAFVRWLWRVTIAAPDKPLGLRAAWALFLSRSNDAHSDARLSVEAEMVTGARMDGRGFFGEIVDETAERRISKAYNRERRRQNARDFREITTRLAAAMPAGFVSADIVEITANAMKALEAQKGEETRHSEPMPKARSTSGPTGAGAPRSASKAGGAKHSAVQSARKSRGN